MDYATVRHYNESNHGSAASLKVTGTERVTPNLTSGNIINQLLKREAYWIYTVNSSEPHGQNESLDLSPFLKCVPVCLTCTVSVCQQVTHGGKVQPQNLLPSLPLFLRQLQIFMCKSHLFFS